MDLLNKKLCMVLAGGTFLVLVLFVVFAIKNNQEITRYPDRYVEITGRGDDLKEVDDKNDKKVLLSVVPPFVVMIICFFVFSILNSKKNKIQIILTCLLLIYIMISFFTWDRELINHYNYILIYTNLIVVILFCLYYLYVNYKIISKKM